jgi:hypothetical protein
MSVNKVVGSLPADESDITLEDPHNLHPDKPGSEPSGTDTQDQITPPSMMGSLTAWNG